MACFSCGFNGKVPQWCSFTNFFRGEGSPAKIDYRKKLVPPTHRGVWGKVNAAVEVMSGMTKASGAFGWHRGGWPARAMGAIGTLAGPIIHNLHLVKNMSFFFPVGV